MPLRRWAGSQDEKTRTEAERDTTRRRDDDNTNMMRCRFTEKMDLRNAGSKRRGCWLLTSNTSIFMRLVLNVQTWVHKLMGRRKNDLRESDACSSAVLPAMFQFNNNVTSIKRMENRYPKVSIVTEVWSLNFVASLFYTGTRK